MWVIAIPIVMVLISVGWWQLHKSMGHHRKTNPGTSTRSWDRSIFSEIQHDRNYRTSELKGKFIKYNGKIYRITSNGFNKTLGRYVSGSNSKGFVKISEDKAFGMITKERCEINENGLLPAERGMLMKICEDRFGDGFTHVVNFRDGELTHADTVAKSFESVTETTATKDWQIKYFKTYNEIRENVFNGQEIPENMEIN